MWETYYESQERSHVRRNKRSHVKRRKINWSITEVITQSPIQANSFQMLWKKLVTMKGMNQDGCSRWLRMEGHGKELSCKWVCEWGMSEVVGCQEGSDLTKNGEVKELGMETVGKIRKKLPLCHTWVHPEVSIASPGTVLLSHGLRSWGSSLRQTNKVPLPDRMQSLLLSFLWLVAQPVPVKVDPCWGQFIVLMLEGGLDKQWLWVHGYHDFFYSLAGIQHLYQHLCVPLVLLPRVTLYECQGFIAGVV